MNTNKILSRLTQTASKNVMDGPNLLRKQYDLNIKRLTIAAALLNTFFDRVRSECLEEISLVTVGEGTIIIIVNTKQDCNIDKKMKAFFEGELKLTRAGALGLMFYYNKTFRIKVDALSSNRLEFTLSALNT